MSTIGEVVLTICFIVAKVTAKAADGKFNGLKYDVWKRTAQSVTCMRHSRVS